MAADAVEDTYEPGSFEQSLALAAERDISAAGGSYTTPDYSSSDNTAANKGRVSGAGCYTDTSCKVLVLTCTDKCCLGWEYGPDGLPRGVDCTTIKKRHPCGACFGWGRW
ncbi:MAG: hypothetical protein JWN04_1460 [Myxococcaceae bacterium]|nr:hypothetical protein [Myxococcaceae bacterium]